MYFENASVLIILCLPIEQQYMKFFSALFSVSIALVAAQAQSSDPCSLMRCPKAFKCAEGFCFRPVTQYQPPINLCYPLKQQAPLFKCTNRNLICNQNLKSSNPSCGFTKEGEKKDFSNDCLPCKDGSIDFYFRQSCASAASICRKGQECINGQCNQILAANEQRLESKKSCTDDKQCGAIQSCFLGKCVDVRESAKMVVPAMQV